MQNLESIVCGCLAILVIRNKATAEVGGEDFCWPKVFSGKTRLTCPPRPDKGNYGELWNRQFHCRVKIPICVGLPTLVSSGPTGKKRTAYANRSAIPFAQF